MKWLTSILRCVLFVGVALAAPSALLAQSQSPLYWNITGTGDWGTAANWNADPSGSGGASGVPVDPTNDAVFNGSAFYGDTTVQLAGPQSARGLYFENTGATLLESADATSQTLTIGTDGIAMAATSGPVTLGDPTNLLPIVLSGSQTWTNDNLSDTLMVVSDVSESVGSTLTIAGAGNTTIAGVISDGPGSLGLVMAGTGTLRLTGASTYSGGTTVSSGTLDIGGGGPTGSIPTGAITVASGATLSYNLSSAFTAAPLTVNGNLSYNSAAQLIMAGTYAGNQITAQGANVSVNGDLTINAGPGGATITGSSTSAAGITSSASRNITTTGDVTFVGSTTSTGQYIDGISLAGVFTATTGTLTFDGTAAPGTAYGIEQGISGSYAAAISTFGNVVFKGTGGGGGSDPHNSDLNLGGLTGNGTVTLIGRARGLRVNSTFTASGGLPYNVVIETTAGDVNGLLGSGTDTTGDGDYTVNSAGSIVFGARTINAGAGTISLTSATGYAINGNSTLQSAALVIGDSNSVTIASGATWTLNTTGEIPNAIGGAGALAIAGGAITLSGANSFTDGTTISAGTLQLGNGGTSGSLGPSGPFVNNGALVLDRADGLTQGIDFSSGGISGTGSLTQIAAGVTTFNAVNSYTGPTAINAGTLRLAPGAALGNTAITMAAGTTFAAAPVRGRFRSPARWRFRPERHSR